MTTLSLLALSALSFACPPPCERLQSRVEGSFTCDVRTYSFDLGNKICEGIMPLCVLRPKDAKDVSAAVIVARESGTPLSYRSGGHSYTCNSIKEDSIHLDLRSLNATKVQPSPHYNGTEISFGTGLNMRQLLDALGPKQMIVHGQCPTVGAGGLFLHGGLHTTLSLKYGRGNDTVTSMEVVTANGSIVQLSDASPHRDLWTAMRQAGSSFAIATRISAKVIEDLPPNYASDGGGFFSLDVPREALLRMVQDGADEAPGLPNYIHVNGADFLIVSADRDFNKNAAWLEQHVLKRKLSSSEWLRSWMIAKLEQPVSDEEGGSDKRFGKSGVIPYIYSSQEAFSDVSFIMPLACYKDPRMISLLREVPDDRDNATDLGCYLQVTTTYGRGYAFVDYNCPYDSAHYQRKQRELNAAVTKLCPSGMLRYVNTPSTFLTPRDYYPNYDALAAIKARWDPSEVFRVYQGVRPTGLPPDAYEMARPYKRTRSAKDWFNELGWDLLIKKMHAR